jgi:hypothetical protein
MWIERQRFQNERVLGKAGERWMNDVEKYLRKMGVCGCRKIARHIHVHAWKLILYEARVLHEPWARGEVRVKELMHNTENTLVHNKEMHSYIT